jgi:threonine aldolase
LIDSPPRRLGRGGAHDPAGFLRGLAEALPPGASPDLYGTGPLVEELEAEIAAVLGKEAAVFCLSGKAAQLAALRVHADARGRKLVAVHQRSHVAEDEDDAAGTLYGLRLARIGSPVAPFTGAELAAVREPLAAVVVELPLRRAGYRVPAWDELAGLGAQARAAGAAFHLDGARLWEAAPGYGRAPAEIAALADSVYVSFYKGLGGLAGGALAADAATVAAARTWIVRAGATPYRMYPYVVAAREGLRNELPRMPAYFARAVELATALDTIEGVAVSPNPPECNAFIVHLNGEHDALLAARDAVTASHGIAVFERLSRTAHPRVCSFELTVEANTLEMGLVDARAAVAALAAHAAG